MAREEEIQKRVSELTFAFKTGPLSIKDVLTLMVQWADEHQPNHWIRIEDKSPEHMKDVLVVFIEKDKPHIGIGSCYPDEYGGIYWRIDGFGLFSGRITHWKQLPELPKGGEK